MKAKTSRQNRFLRIIAIPVRALSKARDMYVKGMNSYADRMLYGEIVALSGAPQVLGLPKSFSVNSSRSYDTADTQELVRSASARSTQDYRVDMDSFAKQQMKITRSGSGGGSRAMPPRSRSVAMGRIDEDLPCYDFGEQISANIIANKKTELKYPRSKYHPQQED